MSTEMRPSQEQALQVRASSSIENSNPTRSSRQSGGASGGAEPNEKKNEKKNEKRKSETPDDADSIGKLVGQFGRWQLIMCFSLCLFQIPNTFHIIAPVYQGAGKDYWCKRPDHLGNISVDAWKNMSRSEDSCHQAVYDWTNVTSPDSMTQIPNDTRLEPCTAWEYATDDSLGNTWVSEWNLVCNKEFLIGTASTVFLVGVTAGGYISGYLSDMFGRKMLLFISAVIQMTTATVLYFATNFWVYLTLRFLLGFVSCSVVFAGMILGIEYADGKWCLIAGMINLVPVPLTLIFMAYLAYLTQDYRILQLCMGIPGFFLLPLWFVFPESPRWLLIKGRIPEVSKIVEHMAKVNKRELPANYESSLKPPPEIKNSGICALFQSRFLIFVSFLFFLIWFTLCLVLFGIAFNVNAFGGNLYLSSGLAGLVEVPALAAAFFLNFTVGKILVFKVCFIAGTILLACATIMEGFDSVLWLKISFLMIGKFIISTGNTAIPIVTAEFYPTSIRNAAVGACNISAGIALIICPYLYLLNKVDDHLLLITLTISSAISAVAVFFIPDHPPAEEEKDA